MKETSTWIRIAYCHDIPVREGRAVKFGNREIAIFNLGDRFYAVDNRCPHKGGPLADGIVSGSTVVCPLHAWKMSLETGNGINGPSTSSCVETFRTRVEEGIVLLELHDPRNASEQKPDLEQAAMCVQPDGVADMNEYLSAEA